MKTMYYIAALTVGTVIGTSSCTNEDAAAKPVITIHELGYDNTGKAQQGSDLHIDAEIVAEGRISSLTVEVHPESAQGWHFDSVYTEFVGNKNADFHKHIEVPADAALGHYHLYLIVADTEGNTTTAEGAVEITVNDGTVVETDHAH